MTTDTAETAIIQRLEQQFQAILTQRMAGVPVVNEKLAVRAIGFHRWQEGWWLGVLVTPWFMNLMLLPEQAPARAGRVGRSRCFTFPSGVYEFITGHEPLIGPYWSCSLFSPMTQFQDQAAAEATAAAALAAVMDEKHLPEPSAAKAATTPPEPLEARLAEPISRRAFLRGRPFGGTTGGRS